MSYSVAFKKAHLLVYAPVMCKKQYPSMYTIVMSMPMLWLIIDRSTTSKAFDQVNYCKLCDRGFCPMHSRLLLYMYTNQKLTVRWNFKFSGLWSRSPMV